MLALYHSGLSTCSKQVRMCLREKGLDYESRYIELWRYENLNPDYLRLNPNGVVPTLVHDGVPIINSLAINEYIDDVWPDPPLRPADPAARARMRTWCWTADDVHLAVMTATYEALLTGVIGDLTPDDLETLLAAIPVPDRQERWRKFLKGGFPEDEKVAADAKMAFGIARVEAALEDSDWLAGDMFSLAEISMLAIVHRIREVRPELVDPTRAPRTEAWRQRLMARPSAAYVYQAGTDEAPPRPPRKSISGLTGSISA